MKVAEILSDLTSLRACDYNDALNLVTVNERLMPTQTATQPVRADAANDHLRIASELVELQYEMRTTHKDGRVDDQLRRAREEVNRVLRELAATPTR
ncbi:uncharacterized protein ANIA_10374 [Aspergillus nidulans FGSC A4]|uniref:Uncharacterized protein n=1 Tax=Emericella nidulans (strain FGSC A4 / ATCC 38163 / CBS 112.46 / NRRL 194 / M139) TaxID=227321 RepID=C8VJ52_EMENI|nr:hypothetical protein [Aspergillus nidulans FGSC A4]CBF83728.1 TPA: hypothetical protein ANIA_10374 [Aspergillus nidulans FGSC A4]